MYMTIWIANETIPWMTSLARETGMTDGSSLVAALDQGGSPITYVFTQLFAQTNMTGMLAIAGIYGMSVLYTVIKMKKIEKKVEEKNYEIIAAGN